MSLAVAIPFGVGSAIVYGASIVVQHRTAHSGTGEADAQSLFRLLRNPVWWFAIGGDFIGFLLQIAALSTGPVVVIQPLVVLMLPVSLFVSYLLGGSRPTKGDYLGCVGVLAGLGLFLGLIGHPEGEHVPHPPKLVLASLAALVIAGVLVLAVIGRSAIIRGATYGIAAGLCFGLLAVMVDAASDRFAHGDGGRPGHGGGSGGLHGGSHGGFHALLATPRGLIPLGAILVLGLGGIALTQLSFQVGALGATLPANLAADPVTGVVAGAILLREHIPLSVPHLIAYVLCLAAIVAGAVRLARPASMDPAAPEPAATGTPTG